MAIQFVRNTLGSHLFESDKVFVIYLTRFYCGNMYEGGNLMRKKQMHIKRRINLFYQVLTIEEALFFPFRHDDDMKLNNTNTESRP